MNEKLGPRCVIQQNAQRIVELHQQVRETFKRRDASPAAGAEWSRACSEFREQFDALAFPGGYESGLQKIRAGESGAIENALAFLEVRPYFFRSQYMRTKFLRLLKHARLSTRQAQRFATVLDFEKEQSERKRRRHQELYEASERLHRPGDPAP
jgi:hypothetical protein